MDFLDLETIKEGEIILLPCVVRRVEPSTGNPNMKYFILESGSFDKSRNFINDLRNTIGNSNKFFSKWLYEKDALFVCETEICDILKEIKK